MADCRRSDGSVALIQPNEGALAEHGHLDGQDLVQQRRTDIPKEGVA